jgi:CheY-like chemotaxis protein
MAESQGPTLVVEGNSRSRRALRNLLSSLGHRVISAANLEQARQYLVNKPSVVIVDLVLPDGNGIEILHQLRNMGGDVTIAVISAGRGDRLSEALDLNPDALFGSPVDIDDFRDWLTKPPEPDQPRPKSYARPSWHDC